MASQAIRRLDQPKALIRRLGWLFGVLLVGGGGLLGIRTMRDWLCDAQRWPLSDWQLSGVLQQTSEQEIWQALQPLLPLQSFMAQDLRLIQRQLEQLPWIAQAQVRKQWPNRLLLHCSEHQAVARWAHQQLLNQQGQRFTAPLAPSTAEQLPQLSGPEGSEQRVLETWHRLTSQFALQGFTVTAMRLNRRQAWQLTLNGSIHCQLGRQDPVIGVQRFLLLHPLFIQRPARTSQSAAAALQRIVDLRYEQGVAVRWAAPPAPTLRVNQDQS
ncbi:FtsQ-type POTRA domain-containing protein [unidentified bacterial endosymbiont]|uniref:FtsQ-type POTRA domain-containing protein n=1 Tax=unidentified bacterial endosymbiont TaxID=2355 RepID=UPI0020A1D20E|nr:FtsQ-type POTRA domain-containing protein [unidentified bacterial endosymbiont]